MAATYNNLLDLARSLPRDELADLVTALVAELEDRDAPPPASEVLATTSTAIKRCAKCGAEILQPELKAPERCERCAD